MVAATASLVRAGNTAWQSAAEAYLRRYHRHEVQIDSPIPDEPCMIVCNHGFGGIVDLNVLALVAAIRQASDHRPITFLVHQLAWSLGVGGLVELVGGRMATRAAAEEAIAGGHHIVVFPGGDIDAGKSFKDRNTITFAGRSGFACLAQDMKVPIVPFVTAGAGESLYVFSDGTGLARRIGTDRLLRTKALPVSLSIPWGLSFGLTGLLPYVPLPTKLSTAVLPAVNSQADHTAEELAEQVRELMQDRMNHLVRDRRPVLG